MKNYFAVPALAGIFFCMLAGLTALPVEAASDETLPAQTKAAPAKAAPVKIAESKSNHFNLKIRAAQMRLADLGYSLGYYDGVIGPKTAKAIKHFQRIHGLKVTGRLTTKAYKVLFMTDYMAHHYYQTAYYSTSGYSGSYSGYPYNRPGHINPANGAWVVNGQDR